MRFFINTWTWGYEEILKAISVAFESKVSTNPLSVRASLTLLKIHVDRYKHEVYTRLSDQQLRENVTLDVKGTRFHACERFSRCGLVRYDDPGVVYINPVSMTATNWELYYIHTLTLLESGEMPSFLVSLSSPSCVSLIK